jgi:hypothetical protein
MIFLPVSVCITNVYFLQILLSISCCKLRKFCDIYVLRMDDSTGNNLPKGGQNVPKSMRYFTNHLMGSQHSQTVSYPSRKAFAHFLIMLVWKQKVSKITVSKPFDLKFSPTNRFEQKSVFRRSRTQRSDPLTFPTGSPTYRTDYLSQRLVHLDRGQGIQIAMIRSLRDLGPMVQVGHPFPHPLPGRRPRRISFFRTIDPKIPRVVHRGLHPQHLTLLVVNLNRIAFDFMFHSDSLRSLAIMADHFPGHIPVGLLPHHSSLPLFQFSTLHPFH